MTILVVGHSGYVGRNLVRWYRAKGQSVSGLTRSPRVEAGSKSLEREFTFDEVETPAFQGHLKSDVSAVIILTADTRKRISPTDVRSLINANAALPAEMAFRAAEAGVPRVVFASTYSIRADGGGYAPQTLYTASKKAAEDLLEFVALEYSTRITALRLYDIYGPNQPHDRFIPYVLDCLQQQSAISMTRGEQEVAPIFIDDVCGALDACLDEEDQTSGVHLRAALGPDIVKVRSIPSIAAEAIGMRLPQLSFDRPERPREIMRVDPRVPFPGDWTPRMPFDEGIRATWARGSGAYSAGCDET